ncbi:MAG: hypothetical protein ACLU5K_05770 [Christensenellales bacterium]
MLGIHAAARAKLKVSCICATKSRATSPFLPIMPQLTLFFIQLSVT